MTRCTLARLRRRGAVFVEAIIIISVMILMLLGIVFFRTFYLTSMRTSRVARAAVMAYSMGGCDDTGGPRVWAGADLDSAVQPTRTVGQDSRPASQLKPAPTASGANAMLTQIPGAPVQGNALFPIADMGLETSAQATTIDATSNAERGFKSKVRSKSYVVCGEQMKDGNIMDLVHFAKSFIQTSAQPATSAGYVEDPPPKLPPEYTDP